MELDVHLVPFGGGFKIVEGIEYDGPYDEPKISCDQTEDYFEMKRGLYDPVLDETDVLYEPIDQEPDFDQPSRPTEVDLDNLDSIILPDFLDSKERELLSESRSVTASPFLCPTKPYRPFSTEPIAQIPELEEPIILNPEYHDDFDKVLLGIDEDYLPKTRFKLPISEQYDPDGTKKIGAKVEDGTNVQEVKTLETKEVIEMKDVSISETKDSFEQITSSIEEIEKTASNIVEESIGKAVVVAEEIKKEIDVALHETLIISSETTESKVDLQTKQVIESYIIDSKVADLKAADLKVADTKSQTVKKLDKTSEVVSNKNKIDVKVAKEKFENLDKKQTEEEIKSSARQEVKETIQAGTVKSKTTVYDKVSDAKVTEKSLKKDTQKKSMEQNKAKTAQTNKNVKENVTKTKTTQSSTKTGTKTKTNGKTKSQENAYFIGLQTIPNIRGTINSNYHFDMLLKTFLVHLTDVMVALSRFILTDPGQLKFVDDIGKCQMGKKEEKEEEEEQHEEEVEEQEEELREEVVTETVAQEETEEQEQNVDVQSIKQSFEDRQVKYSATQEMVAVDETHEKRHLSGSEMAYSEMTVKSEDLIHKLGAVINEFETKTGIETTDGNLSLAERRSRSRSRSKTREIIRQVEPAVLATTIVEAANKMISECQEISQMTASSQVSSSFESRDVKKHETVESSAVQDAKTYVAIVEAHVYTNKDLLQQQMSEFSTECTAKSSAELTNVALISNEAVGTVKVAPKDLEVEKEIIKPAQVESRTLSTPEFIRQAENATTIKEEAFLDKTSSTIETATKIDEEKVFLDKTSSKIDSEITETYAVQERLVQPVQKARIVKGILKQAKSEIKADALKEINQVAETKSTVVEQTEVSQTFDKTAETRVVEEKTSLVTALLEESKIEIKDEAKSTFDEQTEVTQTFDKTAETRVVEEKTSLVTALLEKSKTEIKDAAKSTVVQQTEVSHTFDDTAETKVLEQKSSIITAQVEESKTEIKDEEKVHLSTKKETTKAEIKTEESAALKITKEKATELHQVSMQLEELRDIQKKIEISQEESKSIQTFKSQALESQKVESKVEESYESQKVEESFTSETFSSETVDQECSFMAKSVDQETSFVIKMVDSAKVDEKSAQIDEKSVKIEEISTKINEKSAVAIEPQQEVKEVKKLTLITDIPLTKSDSLTSAPSEISTPTPATVPPTPLTNEYMFRLQCPLPPEPEIPVPRDCTPSDSDDEDPHIVKKGLIPHIDTEIEETIVYDTPLKTPPGSPGSPKTPGSPGSPSATPGSKATPVYTKPGLKGGGNRREQKKEEILEIERKSSLLTSAIDQTIKSIEEYKEEVGLKQQNGKKTGKTMAFEVEVHVENCPFPNGAENSNVLEGYRPVQFNPEELQNARRELKSAMVSNGQVLQNQKVRQPYRTATGEIIGTHQGIVDGLDKAIVDDTAEELGKPGMTEEKIAELISGESEMLREAHVMGLCRVLSTKMHRPDDDSSVDFKKIKPVIESLNHSEVLKALNEELMRTKEEKKKEERKWTTFMQKPQRPVPRVKFGYRGYSEQESREQEPYKPKIVKQPKPKIAPDYKPEDFETGLLPWEERALREPTPPPVAPEDPILIPEEEPEILEAVDPLSESEVPDLEDSGIPLPTPKTEEDQTDEEGTVEIEELDIEAVVEETEKIVEENIETLVEEMETGNVAEQLMVNVQNMVDPNAPLEQQLSQMRAQLAALAQLPGVIQQSLEMVTRQLSQLTTLESQIKSTTAENASEVTKDDSEETKNAEQSQQPEELTDEGVITEEIPAPVPEVEQVTAEELERMRKEEEEMLEEQRRIEKQKKELMEQARLEHESRQVKQRAAPRVGKPTVGKGKPSPVFGPACPVERPVVLPGGRKWRKPQDAYNEAFIAETLAAQAEIIRGKAKGLSYESDLLPYDERINFMKYEKPPISLDHLQESETYKLVHNMESQPLKRVETLTPQICEADYRQKCRSITPCTERMAKEEHLDYPQQVQP